MANILYLVLFCQRSCGVLPQCPSPDNTLCHPRWAAHPDRAVCEGLAQGEGQQTLQGADTCTMSCLIIIIPSKICTGHIYICPSIILYLLTLYNGPTISLTTFQHTGKYYMGYSKSIIHSMFSIVIQDLCQSLGSR